MFSPDDIDKVPYFGIWAEGQPDDRLTCDALAVLRDAAERCADQDMRTGEVTAALAFLRRGMTRPALCRRFGQAFDIEDPLARQAAVRKAFAVIVGVLSP